MGEVSRGPVNTLPGHRERLPVGSTCDAHPDRPAVARVQGETDSFGCEYNDLCQSCLDEIVAEFNTAHPGVCEWCGNHAEDLRDRRDYDEGMYGRVYQVCRPCIDRQNREAAEELARYDAESDWYDD